MSGSSAVRARLVLAIALTDSTFARTLVRGEACWVGRCVHCNTKLVVPEQGPPLRSVTIEHIVPQTHGGDDDLANVALACARCNNEKGRRHDVKSIDDPLRVALERALFEKRAARRREPPPGTEHLLYGPYEDAPAGQPSRLDRGGSLRDPSAPSDTPPLQRRTPRGRGRSRR